MKKYYRVHWRDCPEFSPENAESCVWGTRGQDTFCSRCNGQGYLPSGRECPECGGTGVVEVRGREGYSCCESALKLYEYFNSGGRDEPADDEPVVEFSGRCVGYGFDMEPLVIPDMKHVRWMTWAELRELALCELAQQQE